MEQPTIKEINAALSEYFEVFDIAGARSAALQKTVALRKAKTTWAGKDEHEFMFKIDRFLDEHCTGWRGV